MKIIPVSPLRRKGAVSFILMAPFCFSAVCVSFGLCISIIFPYKGIDTLKSEYIVMYFYISLYIGFVIPKVRVGITLQKFGITFLTTY